MRSGSAVASLTLAALLAVAPAASAADTTTVRSASALAQHNLPSDCWTAVSGKVYDLTAFLNSHQGGVADVVPMCGVDATAYFLANAPASHSTSYLADLAVQVGVLEPVTSSAPSPSAAPAASASRSPSPSSKPTARKTTLTCVKGKLVKKVTALKPKCPNGFKARR